MGGDASRGKAPGHLVGTEIKLPANPEELYTYLNNTKSFTTLKGVERGNAAATFEKANKRYETSYRWPFRLTG